MNTQRTALITGATGYIGSCLCDRLLSEGWLIHIIMRPYSNISLLTDIENSIGVHQHDGTTKSMLKIIDATKPDIVFHLASLFLSEHHPKDIKNLLTSNILLGTQLVEAMTKTGCLKMVNTGTSWQHYQNENYNPVNLYAATKQAFEDILKFYCDACNLKVITLKLFDTYGPDDPRPKLISLLLNTLKMQEPLKLSPGEQLIDLVYIDDVIEAFIAASNRLFDDKCNKHEKFAVTSSKPIRLKDLVEIIVKITGQPISIKWGGRSYRKREVMVPWDKGKLLPDWEPQMCVENGLLRIIKKNIHTV